MRLIGPLGFRSEPLKYQHIRAQLSVMVEHIQRTSVVSGCGQCKALYSKWPVKHCLPHTKWLRIERNVWTSVCWKKQERIFQHEAVVVQFIPGSSAAFQESAVVTGRFVRKVDCMSHLRAMLLLVRREQPFCVPWWIFQGMCESCSFSSDPDSRRQ